MRRTSLSVSWCHEERRLSLHLHQVQPAVNAGTSRGMDEETAKLCALRASTYSDEGVPLGDVALLSRSAIEAIVAWIRRWN